MRRSLRSPVRAILMVIAAGGLLAGCNMPDNTPQEYGSTTEELWLSGCTGNFAASSTTLAGTEFCRCAYNVFVEKVPASPEDKEKRSDRFSGYTGRTFKEINNDLRGDPSKINDPAVVPVDVKRAIEACPGFGSQGENITPGSGPGTGSTVAPVGPVAPGTTNGTTTGTTPGSELEAPGSSPA